nr:endophilin B1 [Hymenolepis microstoma]
MKPCINRIIAAIEEFIEINIASKVSDTFQKNREKVNTSDKLAEAFNHVAIESERSAPNLSRTLKDAADVHLKMATARKSFNDNVNKTFIEDLKSFLSGSLADALKAKTELQESRLDMDSTKSKVKNAKDNETRAKFEAELRQDEVEFDKIHRESVAAFEKAAKDYDDLRFKLFDLMDAQKTFYENLAKECSAMLRE